MLAIWISYSLLAGSKVGKRTAERMPSFNVSKSGNWVCARWTEAEPQLSGKRIWQLSRHSIGISQSPRTKNAKAAAALPMARAHECAILISLRKSFPRTGSGAFCHGTRPLRIAVAAGSLLFLIRLDASGKRFVFPRQYKALLVSERSYTATRRGSCCPVQFVNLVSPVSPSVMIPSRPMSHSAIATMKPTSARPVMVICCNFPWDSCINPSKASAIASRDATPRVLWCP